MPNALSFRDKNMPLVSWEAPTVLLGCLAYGNMFSVRSALLADHRNVLNVLILRIGVL